jgi:hypothetical protein
VSDEDEQDGPSLDNTDRATAHKKLNAAPDISFRVVIDLWSSR